MPKSWPVRLRPRGSDAEGNADAEADKEAEEGELEGGGKFFLDRRGDGLLEYHGFAEIASEELAEVVEVLGADGLIEAESIFFCWMTESGAWPPSMADTGSPGITRRTTKTRERRTKTMGIVRRASREVIQDASHRSPSQEPGPRAGARPERIIETSPYFVNVQRVVVEDEGRADLDAGHVLLREDVEVALEDRRAGHFVGPDLLDLSKSCCADLGSVLCSSLAKRASQSLFEKKMPSPAEASVWAKAAV